MKLAVGILVMLGLLASGAAVLLVQSLRATAGNKTQEKSVGVLVARTDLKAQTKLDVNDVNVADVPARGLPANFLSSAAQVAGAKLLVDVKKGQQITADLITREMTVVDLLHPGMRGFSLSLSRRDSGVGLIQPGSMVDLHVTFPITDKSIGESLVIAPLLQQLPVLAVDGRTVLTSPEVEAATRGARSSNVEVMLEVDDAQARVLQLANQKGKVALPLRNPTDTELYPVQPMIVKQGQYETFGDPLDPRDPTIMIGTITAMTRMIARPTQVVGDANDPNAPNTTPIFSPVVLPPESAASRPVRSTVDVIRGSKRTEEEVKKQEEEQPAGSGGFTP